MYGNYNQGYVGYGYRAAFQPVWATSYVEALDLMRQSVQGEKSDELFYDQLIRLAPNKEHADIISSIRNDERSHNQMFRQMLLELTGHPVGQENAQTAEEKPVTYLQGLKTALFGELSAVERYRKMWFGLPPSIYKDTVFGILLDEQKHADKYNYLIGQTHSGQ